MALPECALHHQSQDHHGVRRGHAVGFRGCPASTPTSSSTGTWLPKRSRCRRATPSTRQREGPSTRSTTGGAAWWSPSSTRTRIRWHPGSTACGLLSRDDLGRLFMVAMSPFPHAFTPSPWRPMAPLPPPRRLLLLVLSAPAILLLYVSPVPLPRRHERHPAVRPVLQDQRRLHRRPLLPLRHRLLPRDWPVPRPGIARRHVRARSHLLRLQRRDGRRPVRPRLRLRSHPRRQRSVPADPRRDRRRDPLHARRLPPIRAG